MKPGPPVFRKDNDRAGVRRSAGEYAGKGVIDIKRFFGDEAAAKPARLYVYVLPPGASEGLHRHRADAPVGAFDEFYYVICGRGEMQIEGEKVPVEAGDHVMVPNGVEHGIENTAAEGDLKVYLIAIER